MAMSDWNLEANEERGYALAQRYVGEVSRFAKEEQIIEWREKHRGVDVCFELHPNALIMRSVEVSHS